MLELGSKDWNQYKTELKSKDYNSKPYIKTVHRYKTYMQSNIGAWMYIPKHAFTYYLSMHKYYKMLSSIHNSLILNTPEENEKLHNYEVKFNMMDI